MKRLAILHAVVIWLGCGAQPSADRVAEDLITVCLSGPCTTTAEPPATSAFLWQPNRRISPVEMNMRFCDSRIPPQQGEVEIYDLPFAQDNNGLWQPQTAAQCAVLKDVSGGYFDWIAFQDYGWQVLKSDGTLGIIRSIRMGPSTKIVFGDRALDINSPDKCDHTGNCVGAVSGVLGSTYYDTWQIIWGFRMASMWISRP